MSGTSGNQPEKAIIESIQAEAAAQGRALLDKAGQDAQAELDQARRAADAVRDELLAKAQRDAAKCRAKAQATANVECQRIVQRAAEDALNAALDAVKVRLEALRQDKAAYRGALVRLMGEAAAGIDEETVIMKLAASDQALADGALVEEATKIAVETAGHPVALELRFEQADLGGGCVAMAAGGHISLDNTLPRRFEEAKRHIKPLIMAEIKKHRE